MKTNKSITKRLRVTKKGKILARKPGQNHFNSRDSGEGHLARKGLKQIQLSAKDRSRFMI